MLTVWKNIVWFSLYPRGWIKAVLRRRSKFWLILVGFVDAKGQQNLAFYIRHWSQTGIWNSSENRVCFAKVCMLHDNLFKLCFNKWYPYPDCDGQLLKTHCILKVALRLYDRGVHFERGLTIPHPSVTFFLSIRPTKADKSWRVWAGCANCHEKLRLNLSVMSGFRLSLLLPAHQRVGAFSRSENGHMYVWACSSGYSKDQKFHFQGTLLSIQVKEVVVHCGFMLVTNTGEGAMWFAQVGSSVGQTSSAHWEIVLTNHRSCLPHWRVLVACHARLILNAC